MVRRFVLIAVFTLLCLVGVLALRPLLSHPVLANFDGPATPDADRLVTGPVVPRAFYGRRLEPRAGVLHGAGQSDRASFDRYSAATGTHPMLWMTYVDLRDNLTVYTAQLAADLVHFDTPDAQVVPQIGLSLNRGLAQHHYEAQTSTGTDDAAIATLCGGLRALDRPVFVRVGYEFNGPWNGYQPEAYTAAFRRIAAALHACSPRIALVWNWSADAELDLQAAGYSTATAAQRRRGFYPGDDAVDWWAVNLFTPQGIVSPATAEFLQAAAQSRHPVMIGESSPKSVGTIRADARALWFAPYFGLLRANPGIKAFCYIDWNWAAYPQWADWGDARLEQSPGLLGWYRGQLDGLDPQNATTPAATAKLLH